ncbi:MAG: tRNA epoxyqueuosine(34) reductase QueG [bacterium]|nr:tRNA epoxyqueuosine(34) reductase QueG [bacterium]
MPSTLKAELRAYADSIGFDSLGICAPAAPVHEVAAHMKWLARGYHAEMGYLSRNPESRYDARSLLPDCRSVVVVALSYYVPDPQWPADSEPKVSRYAWGDDYHDVLKDKLRLLADWLDASIPEQRHKLCVDTSPLTEKAFAVAAGIGWQGRNSLVLSDRLGSYFFIGLLLSTAELEFDQPAVPSCGTCTLCIQACPTNALVGPGILDANRCVSYLTTERKEDVAEHESLSGWLYGCDTCQQVCPFNITPAVTREPRFVPRNSSQHISLDAALALSEPQFEERFAGTVFRRRKLFRLQAQARNLQAAELSNSER